MSWRDILGIKPSTQTSYAHNSHNSQKPSNGSNCADIADSAHRDSKDKCHKLLEVLADACQGLDITPFEVKEAMSSEDLKDWREGAISVDFLSAFACSQLLRLEMDQGKRPAHYTQRAICKHCGPIWLWFSGEVLGCPWCWNRTADKPIPRPCTITCGECINFKRIDHPHLGHCAKGEPEAIAGLWDNSQRNCNWFLPRSVNNRG